MTNERTTTYVYNDSGYTLYLPPNFCARDGTNTMHKGGGEVSYRELMTGIRRTVLRIRGGCATCPRWEEKRICYFNKGESIWRGDGVIR